MQGCISKTIKNQFFEPAVGLEMAGSVQLRRLSRPSALGSRSQEVISLSEEPKTWRVRPHLSTVACVGPPSCRVCRLFCSKCFERRRRRAAKTQPGATDPLAWSASSDLVYPGPLRCLLFLGSERSYRCRSALGCDLTSRPPLEREREKKRLWIANRFASGRCGSILR